MSSDEEVSSMGIVTNMSKDRIRRLTKPLMEKRRRARINSCLNQLKNLVLEAMNQNTSHFSKLEKADILEMTVKHLYQLQRRQAESQKQLDGCGAARFRAGYTECAQEVARCLATVDNSDTTTRVMQHLSSRIQLSTRLDSQTPHGVYTGASGHKTVLRQSAPRSTMYLPVIPPLASESSSVFPRFKVISDGSASGDLKTSPGDIKPIWNIGNVDIKPVLNTGNREIKQTCKSPVKSELTPGKFNILRNMKNSGISLQQSSGSSDHLSYLRHKAVRPVTSVDRANNHSDDMWRPW